MKKLLGIVVLGLLWCNVSFASCYEAMITTPSPFMGNHGEIFELDDGTIWEVQFEYEYLYEYYPTVIVCPSEGIIAVSDEQIDVIQLR